MPGAVLNWISARRARKRTFKRVSRGCKVMNGQFHALSNFYCEPIFRDLSGFLLEVDGRRFKFNSSIQKLELWVHHSPESPHLWTPVSKKWIYDWKYLLIIPLKCVCFGSHPALVHQTRRNLRRKCRHRKRWFVNSNIQLCFRGGFLQSVETFLSIHRHQHRLQPRWPSMTSYTNGAWKHFCHLNPMRRNHRLILQTSCFVGAFGVEY